MGCATVLQSASRSSEAWITEPRSSGLRTGGQITFRSPMSSPLPPGSEQSNTDHQPTVLLVDDEPAVRSALRRFFARRGWSVVEAADGESACGVLEPSSGNAFELVICDLNMPRLSG